MNWDWVVDILLNDTLWSFFVPTCAIVLIAAFLFILIKREMNVVQGLIERNLLKKGWKARQITTIWHGFRVEGINPDGQMETKKCILVYDRIFWQDSEGHSS